MIVDRRMIPIAQLDFAVVVLPEDDGDLLSPLAIPGGWLMTNAVETVDIARVNARIAGRLDAARFPSAGLVAVAVRARANASALQFAQIVRSVGRRSAMSFFYLKIIPIVHIINISISFLSLFLNFQGNIGMAANDLFPCMPPGDSSIA